MRRKVVLEVEYRVTRWHRVEGDPAWAKRGVAAYRIWLAHDGYRWWQCHEWEKIGGNAERFAERWIPTGSWWPRNAVEPAETDEPPDWSIR